MIISISIIAICFIVACVAIGVRQAILAFVLCIPLFMYQKSLYITTTFFGFEVVLLTLTKDFAAFCILLIVMLRWVGDGRLYLDRGQRNLLSYIAVITILSMVSSLWNDLTLMEGVAGLRAMVWFPLVAILLSGYLKNNDTALRYTLLFACVVIAVIALLHRYVDGALLIHEKMKFIWFGKVLDWFTVMPDGRLQSIMASANTLAYFMGLGLLLLFSFLPRFWYARTIWMGGVLLVGVVLIYTSSRSALLALLVSVTYLAVKTSRRMAFGVVVSTVVLAAVFMSNNMDRVYDASDNPRLEIWKTILLVTLQPSNVIFGNGVGSIGKFGSELKYSDAAVDNIDERLGGQDRVFFVDNYFLRLLYEMGFVGFSVWGLVLLRSLSVIREFSAEQAWMGAIMLFVLCVSFFGDSLGAFPWNYMFWIFFAIGLRMRRDAGASETPLVVRR